MESLLVAENFWSIYLPLISQQLKRVERKQGTEVNPINTAGISHRFVFNLQKYLAGLDSFILMIFS